MQKAQCWLVLTVWALAASVVDAATTTQARLLLAAEATRPGETVWAGVLLKMAKGWHTYWRNAGEAGGPTEIKWSLPTGVTAGDIHWPLPEKYVSGGITTYVYHDEVVLLVPLTVAAHVASGTLEIKADVSWLECEELCLPGKATLNARLAIANETKSSPDAARLEATRKILPQAVPDLSVQAYWEPTRDAETRPLVIAWESTDKPATVDFFPYANDAFDVQPATERLPDDGRLVRLRKLVSKFEGDWPAELNGLLVTTPAGASKPLAYEVKFPIRVSRRAAAPGPIRDPAPPRGNAESQSTSASLLVNLSLAFLGGLILNLMPCVLPVIALKILGFVNQSHGSPARTRKLGLVYGLGVVVSLWALAGFVIAVQQAGQLASWGMQFQNPIFVVAITTLVTLVALNLFGVFEVNLGGGALGAAGALAAKEGAPGAFFNGVLAVVLATPCTAPFLSVALGYAFLQPPLVIALMFTAVAVGLAFPSVLLSIFPQWLRFLPKPGAWMERFKVAMGFPMLATAVWLLTLTEPHFGANGVLWVGLFLVTVAVAVWIWGQFVQRGTRRQGLAKALALLIPAFGYWYALENELHWRTPAPPQAGSPIRHSLDGIAWQPWSRQAVERARAEGHPVLVDFTADWCLTCKANKKTSLEISSVRQKLQDIQAVPLVGDYTLKDPAITEELKRFDRAGVPLVLVYPKDADAPPLILPTVLTPGIVLEALDKAAQ